MSITTLARAYLAAMLALALAGCGGESQEAVDETATNGTEQTASEHGQPDAPSTTDAEASAPDLERVKKEFGEAMTALADLTAEQRAQAAAQASNLLATMDGEIATLQERMRERINDLDGSTRDQLRDALDRLKTRREAVQAAMAKLDSESTQAAWTELKAGLAESYAALRSALEDARQAYAEVSDDGSETADEETNEGEP